MSKYADIVKNVRVLWSNGCQVEQAFLDTAVEYNCPHMGTILYTMAVAVKDRTGTWAQALWDLSDILEGKDLHYISVRNHDLFDVERKSSA